MIHPVAHARRLACRVRRAWAEMEDAQLRLFEQRTGFPSTGPRGPIAVSVEELERLYRLPSARP